MQLIGKILHKLTQPTLDRLIAWRNAYPNTPLKYLPLPVRAEVKHILTSALAPTGSTQDTIRHPVSPAASPQPIISPPVTTNGSASAQPANGTPRPAPARTILPGLRPQVPPITSGLNRGRQIPSLRTVIGTDVKTGEVTISQQAKQQGTYIVGVNGTGKTTLVENMVLSDIRQGLGICLIEPHGDLTAKILAGIPRHRLNDIIYLDIEDFENPFGLNIFDVPEPRNIRTEATVASFISHTFGTLWNSGFETPRLMQNLRSGCRSIIANPGAHFGDIPLLYSNEEVRARMLANVTNPQILAFWEEYERMNFRDRRLFTESFLNKVTAFLDEPMIAHILSQSKTTIDFRYIMDNSKILLIKLSPQFEEASVLIGAVLIGKILMTAFSRADIPDEDKRVQFNLYCDEFHRFASSDFATLISEARKFKISTILSHQVLSQLPEATRASALGAGNLICFRVSGEDARVLSKSFNTTPSPIIIGEEVVRAPVADVISHLVRQGHHDPRVASFGTTYLANLERFLNKPPSIDPHETQYSACHHNFHAISLSERHLIWAREFLNEAFFKAMIEKRSDVQLPALAIYILAVSQGDGREYILSNWVKKSFHDFAGFKPGAEKFGKPSFVTPLRSQDYIAQITKVWNEKYVWMAEAIVTMLKETRYCLEVLSTSEPIMGDTGRMQPRYQMQGHADRELEISKELTIQRNFTAKVKLVNGAEYDLQTLPAPETLSGDALTERIEAVKRHCRALGYTRHYTEVIEDLRKRQEFLFGLGDSPNDAAYDDGDDQDELQDSFTLD